MNSTLRGQIIMELATRSGISFQIPVRLTFDRSTPWAVGLTFLLPGDDPVRWTVSRELLLDGLSDVAGDGDIQVRPVEWLDQDLIAISLRSPDGEAELLAPLAALHAFLLRTDLIAPFGQEFPEEWLDRGIAGLLGTGAELRK